MTTEYRRFSSSEEMQMRETEQAEALVDVLSIFREFRQESDLPPARKPLTDALRRLEKAFTSEEG